MSLGQNDLLTVFYRETDGAIVQVLDFGLGMQTEIPVQPGSDAENFILRVGVRVP